jgi:hypothetical protein
LDNSTHIDFFRGVHNILQQIEHIHAYCKTGNAHGKQACAASSASDNDNDWLFIFLQDALLK